mgnify:CR=1 FL=1
MMALQHVRACLLACLATALVAAHSDAESTETADSSRSPTLDRARNLSERARRIQRRRQFTARGVPYGVTGIPFAVVTADRDWGIGGRIHFTDLQRAPFRYKLTASWVRDPRTGDRYLLRWLAPRIADTDMGLLLVADLGRSHGRFYGFGNSSLRHHPLLSTRYDIDRRNLTAQLRRWLSRQLWFGIGTSWRDAGISVPTGPNVLATSLPGQLGSTQTVSVSVALAWDTRDDPSHPDDGVLHSWSMGQVAPDLAGALGDPPGRRWTISDLRYYPFAKRYLLVLRHLFEVVNGTLPLDMYGELGDPERTVRGVGGDGSIRGYAPNRFQDDVRFLTSTEVHRHLGSTYWLRQYLEWRLVGFIDAGRVWHHLSQVRPGRLHSGMGAGVRVIWDEDFVVRLEVARSSEDRVAFVKLSRSY